jgi:HK97 family phage prohead protease
MTDMIRKYVRVDNNAVGDRQVRIVASDATVDRSGDVMVAAGCDISDYKANPIVLAQHDAATPIGKSKVTIKDGRVEALIDFAPPGVSVKADEYCGLAKAGIISAASVGFEAGEWEPLKNGGRKYTKWKLLEISLVSIPANPSALMVARSALPAAKQRVGGSRSHRLRSNYHGDKYDGEVDYPVRTPIDAWLKAEWPGLPWSKAYEQENNLVESLSHAACKARWARKQKIRLSFAEDALLAKAEEIRRDRLTPDEAHARRAAIIKELEGPRPTFFKWDPMASAGENMIKLRQFQFNAPPR